MLAAMPSKSRFPPALLLAACALALIPLNFILLGIPGMLLFGLGDAIAGHVFGLRNFSGEWLIDISFKFIPAWVIGVLALLAMFELHRRGQTWRVGKVGLFVTFVLVWNVALSSYFHRDVLEQDSRQREALEQGSRHREALEPPPQSLVYAAGHHDPETVKALVAAGAKVDQRNACGDTPLMAAVHSKNVEIAEYLLQAGAKLDFQGACSFRPDQLLLYAAGVGDVAMIGVLAKKGAAVDEADYLTGYTALTMAASKGEREIVQALLDNGANIDFVGGSPQQDPAVRGMTALMHAAANGQRDVVRLLLLRGAQVSAKDVRGMTPLVHAAMRAENYSGKCAMANRGRDYRGTIDLLLAHGADRNDISIGRALPNPFSC